MSDFRRAAEVEKLPDPITYKEDLLVVEKIKVIEGMDSYLPDVDGVVNAVHNYCLNIRDRTELCVIVPKNRKGYVDNLPYKVMRCKSMHIPILNDYYGFPQRDKKFIRSVRAVDADIIHVHSPFNMAKFALKIAKEKNIPVVATFHSNMRPIFKSVLKFNFLTEIAVRKLGKLYNKFDEVFVCSPIVGEQLRSYGYTGKISYLPFGTDLERCEDLSGLQAEANEKFDLRPDELVFLYVGRVMHLKRIDFILRSLRIVKDDKIPFRFFVVGKGAELKKLQKLAKKLGFSEKEVIFTGFLPREQFPLINARANLFLFPSLYDNFGLVKIEAAAYSTPGVFIDGSCAGYGVVDGVNGYLSKNTEQSFAEKIEAAVSDPEKLKKVGENAARDLYISWKDCSDKLMEKYEQIVAEHNSKNNNEKILKEI